MPNTSGTSITPRSQEIDETAGIAFDAVHVARDLLRSARVAALSTLDPQTGYPYGTVTNLAVQPDGTPYFFVARLALHARNIEADPRISLTLSALRGDVLTHPRLTLVGRAQSMAVGELEQATRRYVARFPKAKLYLGLPDAMFYRVEITGVQLNGGPARNAAEVTAGSLQTDLHGAEALVAAEAALIEASNGSQETLFRVTAAAGVSAVSGKWKVTGIDPDGLDLRNGETTKRFWFPARVEEPDALIAFLNKL